MATIELSGKAYLRLVLLGALIGIPAAVAAALFLWLVDQGQDLLWTDLPTALGHDSPPWYLVLLLPGIGGLLVLAVRRLLPGDGGHPPLEGFAGHGATPLRSAPGIALAAFATLAFGAVLGPEAPLIALGSAVGVALTLVVRLGPRETEVMGVAGSFSAVSAIFGGPLVAGMLLLEGSVGLGAMAVPVLLPGLVAAAVGYLAFVGVGSWSGLGTSTLKVPDLPAYDGTSVADVLMAVIVGIAAAVVMHGVRRLAVAIAAHEHDRYGLPVLLVGGGLTVGGLAVVADLLGVDSQEVLFSGQAAIPDLVQEPSATAVAVVLAAKALAYAICLGAGFRGGPVFPGVFLGIGVAMLGVVWFDVSPTLTVCAGAAAGMTAATGLVFSSLLFAALLVGTGGVDALPAAVLAVAAARITSTALDTPGPRAPDSQGDVESAPS